MNPPPVPAQRPRSLLVTLVAWLAIIGGVLALPVSLITVVALLVKSYGTQSATLGGFLTVVCGPPALVAAGLGLIRRRRWAWFCLLALLVVFAAHSAYEMLRPPRPTTVTVSPNGVKTTTLGDDAPGAPGRGSPVPLVLSLALFGLLLTPGVRAEFES